MDWKVLAALGAGVALFAGGSSKASARPKPAPAPTPDPGLFDDEDEQAPDPETEPSLDLKLAQCKAQAEVISPDWGEVYPVDWESAVKGYNAAADLYEDGEDDPFELAVAAMDAMLPSCDWGALSEEFTSEELGDGALYRVWTAADEFAAKVIQDIPVDVYEPEGEDGCAEGWEFQQTEWGLWCVPSEDILYGELDDTPVEMSLDLNPQNIPALPEP